jgi:hypothetical protein
MPEASAIHDNQEKEMQIRSASSDPRAAARRCITLFAAAGASMLALPAFGQFVPFTQERSVSTDATMSSGEHHEDLVEAGDFGLFDRSIGSSVTGAAGASADARASQTSNLTTSTATGTLAAGSDVRTGSTFVVGEAGAHSNLLYIFEVEAATEVQFTASGSLELFGRNPDGEPADLYGLVRARLVDAATEETIAGFSIGPQDEGTDQASFSGTLEPGIYVIIASAQSYGYSADLIGPPARTGWAQANVEFALTAGGGDCEADFNGDNQADFFDYLDFAAAFDAEDPSADFNGDNQVDFFDYLDFAAVFDAGC